jgi:SOS-response transcriptional repressor LexA
MPLTQCEEHVTLPAERIERGEIVLRVADDIWNLDVLAGDLLIVARRTNGRAATGEFVVATLHDLTFVGRWWGKHGARALLDDEFHVIVNAPEMRVFGAVTLIARAETR